jgi:hypothetical protein
MTTIKAYYDGQVFVPENPVAATINQKAIITLLDEETASNSQKNQLLSLAGSISHEDYLEIEKALEDTEKVNPNDG